MRGTAFWYYQNIAGYVSQALKKGLPYAGDFFRASGVVVGQEVL
jgi:hypothetical protein